MAKTHNAQGEGVKMRLGKAKARDNTPSPGRDQRVPSSASRKAGSGFVKPGGAQYIPPAPKTAPKHPSPGGAQGPLKS